MTKKDDPESNALVKHNSKRLITSKGRSQISLTTNIIKAAATSRASSQALVDDSWIEKIWEWADKFGIGNDSIPRNRVDLLKLESIRIVCSDIYLLHESIGNLSNLKELYAYNNSNLDSLLDSIGNLSNLDNLEANDNNLTSLPESIVNLSNLRWLHIEGNNLDSLPDSIGNLSNLYNLNASDNNITSLPDSIDQTKTMIIWEK